MSYTRTVLPADAAERLFFLALSSPRVDYTAEVTREQKIGRNLPGTRVFFVCIKTLRM